MTPEKQSKGFLTTYDSVNQFLTDREKNKTDTLVGFADLPNSYLPILLV